MLRSQLSIAHRAIICFISIYKYAACVVACSRRAINSLQRAAHIAHAAINYWTTHTHTH